MIKVYFNITPKPYLAAHFNDYMKKLLLLFLLCLSLGACKKDSTTPDPTTPDDNGGTTNPSEKQLVKTSVQTSANGKNTTTYTYDSSNRVVSVRVEFAGAATTLDEYAYTFNADGNVSKQTHIRNGKTVTYDYTYVNKAPTLLTFTDPTSAANNYTVKLTYNGTATTSGTFYNLSTGTPPVEQAGSTETFEYQNQNFVKQSSVSPGVSFLTTRTYEYGTKKSPFLYTGDKWLLTYVPFANKNDLIKEVYTTNGSVQTTTYTNTYNNQGYPVNVIANSSQVISGISAPQVSQYTIAYTYVNAR